MPRGKLWTFVRPRQDGKVMRFENTGDTFSAMYQAQRWLYDNGYKYGSSDWGPYIPAMKGERYTLPQKLYNFDLDDYMQVTAVMYSGDYRDGWVEVWLIEPMYVLDLVLCYKWYDMIERGEKLEEYRDLDKWRKRLNGKPYTHIRFRRGYTSTTLIRRIEGITAGIGKPEWGAPQDKRVLILQFSNS